MYQAGAERIAFDVAQDGPEVLVLLHGEGLEAALPDVAAAAILLAVAADVGGHEPVHPGAEVGIAVGPDGTVEVIGHQAVRQQAHGHAGRSLAEEVGEGGVVAVMVEDLSAGVATVEGVVAVAAHGSACGSGHDVYCALTRRGGQGISGCPRFWWCPVSIAP